MLFKLKLGIIDGEQMISLDMAEKSIAEGIPVLVSKSVPTADAVDLALRYGLVIIGNARPDCMKLFT